MGLYFATLSTVLLYGTPGCMTRSRRPDYRPAVRRRVEPLAANDPEATALRHEVEALSQRLAQLETLASRATPGLFDASWMRVCNRSAR